MSSSRGPGGPLDAGRWWRTVLDRPVCGVAALGVVLGGGHLAWVHARRGIGGLGVDEAAFAATAVRLERALRDGGLADWWSTGTRPSASAPLVPMLTAPVLRTVGTSTTSLMVVPVLVWLLAGVLAASVARRLAGPVAGWVAGLVCLGLPTAVVGARTYQLATVVTVGLLAAWSFLLRSDGGRRRRDLVFAGLAVGVMLLGRTMAVAFVPAVLVATLVVVDEAGRRLRAVALVAGGAAVVAGPWWIGAWSPISRYLFGFGYGAGSEQIERIDPAARLPVRAGLAVTDLRVPYLVVAAIASVVALRALRGRDGTGGRAPDGRWRRGLATATRRGVVAGVAIVVVGLLVLLTSSNSGSWFQVPLETVALVVLVVVTARTARRPRPLAVAAVVTALANVALISNWRPFAGIDVGGPSASIVWFGGTEEGQAIDVADDDVRFAPSASWAERREAEREWSAAIAEVIDVAISDGARVLSVVGELRIASSGAFALSLESSGRTDVRLEAQASPEADRAGVVDLAPRQDGATRVLVVLVHRRGAPTGRIDTDAILDRAGSAGWTEDRTVPLPAGASALVLRHRSNTR